MKRFLSLALLFAVMIGCEGDYTIYDAHPPEVVYVDVPVEVPVEVPGDGGDVWIDSFEQPFTMDGIDIVWLIDKSGSMTQHANSVVAGIEQMMLSLPPAGWRLGITTSSWTDSNGTQQFPLVPGDTVQDAWDAYNNTGNGHYEAGFDALYAYLIENQYNQSWLRQDAGLLVVFVSDEDEQSTRDFTSTAAGLQDFINWYGHQRNSVFLASIINIHETQNDCTWGVPALYVGDRYMDATNAFGGVVVDICSPDWAPGVQAATAQTAPHEEWELTYTPLVDTLIIFEDFVEKDSAEWQYNALTNSVEFVVIPPEGALVEIGYVIDYDAGDDDDSAGDDDDSAGS
tara:strand:- start:9174 stop:10199 length:1026 start_codon:yes stop_codon:yes gene_type:complete